MSSVFVVTGGAGFIGSHLVERLLRDHPDAVVRILDDFSSGSDANLPFAAAAGPRLEIVRGDVRDLDAVERALAGASVVFHQAAMRSVPRSVADPLGANANNVTGTLHVLEAARRHAIKRVVYASSSSVYGDRPELPKREDQTPTPISPYAVSKAAGEQYAQVWTRLYGVETVGLRYFNVFGPRQDPQSEYAAVIPKFVTLALAGRTPVIFGDGAQSRDFCFIDNVVEANFKAAAAPAAAVSGRVFNVACGVATTLNQVVSLIGDLLGKRLEARHDPERAGDIKHSLADISAARAQLGYTAAVSFSDGLRRTLDWYKQSA
ncbi:MAG TPA: SDR family oxidoreductase [Methylomirabilota bacterium]